MTSVCPSCTKAAVWRDIETDELVCKACGVVIPDSLKGELIENDVSASFFEKDFWSSDALH